MRILTTFIMLICIPFYGAQAHARHAHHRYHVRHHGVAYPTDRPAVVAREPLVREAMRWVGYGNMTGHSGPWCKWFLNMVAKRSGYHYTQSGMARDAARMGPRTAPAANTIGVMGHHTEIIAAVVNGWAYAIGGNGHGRRVTAHWRPVRSYSRFIRPVHV
jgi:hypothetical protein